VTDSGISSSQHLSESLLSWYIPLEIINFHPFKGSRSTNLSNTPLQNCDPYVPKYSNRDIRWRANAAQCV